MSKFKTSIKPLSINSNRYPLQFSIIVPSTNLDKPVSDKVFNQRVKQEKEYLGNLFGGETAIKGTGDYVIKTDAISEKRVPEKVYLIEASTTPEKFEQNRQEIESHIQKKQISWKQAQVLYKIEGETFLYPKKEQYGSDDLRKNIKIN